MQEMRMQWSVGEDSHWRRMEPIHLCVCYGFNVCVAQNFHMLKSWLPWWRCFIGGAFGRWWSYWGDEGVEGGGDEGWSLLDEMTAFIYKRHTEFSSPSPAWGCSKKCVTREGPAWPCSGNPFPLFLNVFKSVIFCYSSPKGLRQHYNNL